MVPDEPESSGVSRWTIAALALASLAFVSPWTFDSRLMTQGLGGAALLVGGFAALTIAGAGKDSERLSGFLVAVGGAVMLGLATFTPGLLRDWWAPQQTGSTEPLPMFAVPLTDPGSPGKPVDKDDWVPAATDGIRQAKLFVAVDAVSAKTMPSSEDAAILMNVVAVQVRLVNVGSESIPVAGFAVEGGRPRLTDSGKTLGFLEAHAEVPGKGKTTFDPEAKLFKQLSATGEDRSTSYLLLFERTGTAKFQKGKLEIPAAVWNQKGVCRFLLQGSSDKSPATKKS
jgi:hypothetical protein